MPSRAKFYYYWDSCVFISYLEGDPNRIDGIREVLKYVQNHKDTEIVTSTFSIAEVVMIQREKDTSTPDPEIEKRIRNMWYSWGIKPVDMFPSILHDARTLVRSTIPSDMKGLKPKDAIHLATVLWANKELGIVKEVHTYDKAWRTSYGVFLDGILVCEPYKPLPTI